MWQNDLEDLLWACARHLNFC